MEFLIISMIAVVLSFFLGKKIGFDDGIKVGANEILYLMGGGPLPEEEKEPSPEGNKVLPFPDGDNDGGNC